MDKINKITKIISIALVVVVGIGFSIYFIEGEANLQTYDGPPKAVIIDQLFDDMPSERFHLKATEYLENAGYNVDIVTTKDITVDFYKELPKMNYQYVVVRSHGAEQINDVVLFTGERYTEDKYIQEQLFGQVQKAAPFREISYKINGSSTSNWQIINETSRILTTSVKPTVQTDDEYFAIGPNLINNAMKGQFDDTIFLLGGCNTLSNPSLAQSLMDRGASLVVGWDDTVGNVNNDYALLLFLEDTLSKGLNVEETIEHIHKKMPKERMAYPASFEIFEN